MKPPTQADMKRWGEAWQALRESDATYAADVLEMLDMLYDQWILAHTFSEIDRDAATEQRRRGGSRSRFDRVHQLAVELWRKEPDQSKAEVAQYVVGVATGAPESFGLPRGVEISYRTIYDRLRKATKGE